MPSEPAGGRGGGGVLRIPGGGVAGDPLTGTAAGSLTGAGAGLGACGDNKYIFSIGFSLVYRLFYSFMFEKYMKLKLK